MHDIDNINSILNAVNEINLKSKKKILNPLHEKNFIPKLNQDLKISSDINMLILEAEEYKKKSASKFPQASFYQNKNESKESKIPSKTLEDVKAQIIDDLYSKLSKKFKKKTLKVIFDLHLKIKNLESGKKNTQIQKNYTNSSKKKNIISSPIVDLDNTDDLRKQDASTLSLQTSTTEILNKKLINFIKIEESLRFKIIDLSHDKQLLLDRVKKFNESKDYKNSTSVVIKNLKLIYKQVEKQKKIFIELKNYSIKAKLNSAFFKENYEKLIVENNKIKKILIDKE